MEFRILGPLSVARDGTEIDIGGPRQQIVLAALLLASPRVASVDGLVDAVWPDAPPATARGQIQICISRLRRLTGDGPARIVTRPTGYVIELDGAAFDLREFDTTWARAREAVAAGRAGEAAAVLRDALDLWRGPALSGIASSAVQHFATRLADRRIDVVEEFLDLELALGRHVEVIDRAALEVDRHPLRDRLRGQLMLALYRAGRQADALREFQRARRTSIDELGLEPGEALRRLEQAILIGDPALRPARADDPPGPVVAEPPPTVVPRMLPAPIADFTGRVASIAAVTAALLDDRDPAPSVPIAVISGQGGVGKSALALDVAHRVVDAFPEGQLFAVMHGTTRPVRAAQALERFLRALGVPATQIPETLDERAELYRSRLAGRRVLVVLDDIGSVGQVLPLLPPAGGSALLVTSRRRITALPGARRVELGSFGTESAVALLGRIIGAERVRGAPDDAAELVRLCGHLPLAVRIAAARLAARPHWTVGTMVDRLSDEADQLDELHHEDMGVRASLQLGYEALEPRARELLRLTSLIDAPDFGGWVAPTLLGGRRRVAQDVMGELVEMHLVDVDSAVDGAPDELTRYRLHDLVRLFARERAAQEDSTESRTAAITRFLGALMQLLDDAHRREYGGDFLVLHSAAPRHTVDVKVSDRLLTDPLRWLAGEQQALVAAVAQAAAVGDHRMCWDLAVSSVTLFEAHAHYDEWRETHTIALSATRQAGDRLGEAAVLYSLGSLALFEQKFDVAGRQLTAARSLFDELDCRQGVAMALRNQGVLERLSGDHSRARSVGEEALAIFRETGDRVGEAHVLSGLAQIEIESGDDELALTTLRRAAEICAEIENRRVGAQVTHRLGELYLRQGRFDEAAEAFAQVLAFADRTGDTTAEVYGLSGAGAVQMERGEWAEARSTLLRAEQLAGELGENRMQARVLTLLSTIALRECHLDVARSQAEAAIRAARRHGAAPVIAAAEGQLGDVLATEGDAQEAYRMWAAALDRLDGLTQPAVESLADHLASRLGGST